MIQCLAHGKYDLRGKTIGHLLVLCEHSSTRLGVLWRCECLLCGELVVKLAGDLVRAEKLKRPCSCKRCSYKARWQMRVEKHTRIMLRELWQATGSLYAGHDCALPDTCDARPRDIIEALSLQSRAA